MASRDPTRVRSRRSIAHVPKAAAAADKENSTTDGITIPGASGVGKSGPKEKKSRSKSLGPGGLDALQNSNGNRRKSTAAVPLKSILKPSIPLSPPRQIPTFDETRRRNANRSPSRGTAGNGAQGQASEGTLIDFSSPSKPPVTGTDRLDNPFDNFNAVSPLRDAKEREERERREREKQAILEQREARRKSMANRRVSFAPEATLHTWNVVELNEDSTSSSAANSTRRASSLARDSPSSAGSEEDSDASFSPVRYGAQDMSSSPFSGSSVDDSETQSPSRESGNDAGSDMDTDFDGESTSMSLDDVTTRTSKTNASGGDSTDSSARLNRALEEASRHAGTRNINYDENGEASMEIADQEITGAFKPWIAKGQRISFDMEDISALHDQENVNSVQSPRRRSSISGKSDNEDDEFNEDEELSMDITNAVGRILASRVNAAANRRKSTSEQSVYGEKTMELTNVVGGIAAVGSPAKSDAGTSEINENEEMTMEFTSVVGRGVLSSQSSAAPSNDANNEKDGDKQQKGRNFSEWATDNDDGEGMDMEITGAVGRILSPITERTEESQDDHTAGMDFTTAMGRILPPASSKQGMPLADPGSDAAQSMSSPFRENVSPSPPRPTASPRTAAVASETGSPSLAEVRIQRAERISSAQSPAIRLTPSRRTTPEKPVTPSKQMTPRRSRPTTPSKTPPSNKAAQKSASPRSLRQKNQTSSNKDQTPRRRSLFETDAQTGQLTPTVVFPRSRRPSGLGVDKEGLGSPKVAAILDRRRSIGEDANEFVPQEQPLRQLRFEDPLKLQEEVDRERQEEEIRESGRNLSVSNDQDSTSNLRELISSLTPKKKKVGNRKSLHVGTAKGILGKRPVELDQSDEDDDTPKRLRGRPASPVKNVKLPAPPSVDETVGRRNAVLSPGKMGSLSPRRNPVTQQTSPSKSVEPPSATPPEAPREEEMEEGEPDWEPITLQDFLNMTNIHFMELDTTKRRHTTAPGADQNSKRSSQTSSGEISLEDCVAAGLCTVPMLELYQHSCRELKSYISEGRQIIRSIETETYNDNPPLFREYVTARPDIRVLMDNQFRNVKTHARLLSKAMWYEWRMKLLDGLKEGLDRHAEDVKADDAALSKQEKLLDAVVPGLVEKHASLESEARKLQEVVDEFENCDQEELRQARERLAAVDAEIAAKKQQLQAMQQEYQERVDVLDAGAKRKAELLNEISEAERIQEECRGWSLKEVKALKESVCKLEQQTGWSIISAQNASQKSPAGPILTMLYKDELQSRIYPKLFKNNMAIDNVTPLELTYSPRSRGSSSASSSPSAAKSLILAHLRRSIAMIQPSQVSLKQVLRFVSTSWDLAHRLEEEIRALDFSGVTRCNLIDNHDAARSGLRARCMLVGPIQSGESQTARVDVDFQVTPRAGTFGTGLENLELETDVTCTKVYGFGKDASRTKGLTEAQMRDIILRGLGANSTGKKQRKTGELFRVPAGFGQGIWGRSVRELSESIFVS